MTLSDIILNDEDIDVIGDVELRRDEDHSSAIRIETSGGNIWLGGDESDGDLVVNDHAGVARIHLDGGHGSNTDPAHVRVFLDGKEGNLWLGGDESDGDLVVNDSSGAARIHLDGGSGSNTDAAHVRLFLDGNGGNVWLGGDQKDGDLVLKDEAGEERVHLNSGRGGNTDPAHIRAFIDGDAGAVTVGGDGKIGSLAAHHDDGTPVATLDGAGHFRLRTAAGEEHIHLSTVGATHPDARFSVDGKNARIHLGTEGQYGQVIIADNAGEGSVFLHGERGDFLATGSVSGSVVGGDELRVRDGGSLVVEDENDQSVLKLKGDGTLWVADDIRIGRGSDESSLLARIEELERAVDELQSPPDDN